MTYEEKRIRPGTIPTWIALIIGAAYLLYIVSYFGGLNSSASANSAEAVGRGIATMIVMPHMICLGCAVLFNLLGVVLRGSTGFQLTAGILYTVSAALFVAYFMFVVVEAVLCFIGYARRKKALKALNDLNAMYAAYNQYAAYAPYEENN